MKLLKTAMLGLAGATLLGGAAQAQTLYIVGSIMDYKESPAHSGFDFTNPNETGRCGCGESFTVKK